ncbi:DUF1214 domain-containing protein [Nocardia aobensis]|uniref:DUF1214 domain-containing protein n=1 Tax=Nocardia aobensis TaxID=257277 RepID=A0ABW6P545_9NOCA
MWVRVPHSAPGRAGPDDSPGLGRPTSICASTPTGGDEGAGGRSAGARLLPPLLQTDNPYPSLMSLSGTVRTESDGSIVLWFGPTAPDGRESNWIQTLPGKSWFPILRLYGPLQPWFDTDWKPGEITETH